MRAGPLKLEIGFGNALFLVSLAEAEPESNIVGIEISVPSIKNAESRIAKKDLKNVRLIRASANTAIWLLFKPSTIESIFVNFPDPWPKAKHHRRRLISDHFLDLLASRMSYQGVLNIATDHKDYAASITETLGRSRYFEPNQSTQIWLSDRVVTKYERKAHAEGRLAARFQFVRNSIFVQESFSVPEEFDMPHVVLQSPVSLEEISSKFQAVHFSDDDADIRFIDCFYSSTEKRLVIDTFIRETPLEQRVMIAVTRRREGDFLVNLHDCGFPRATFGIQRAILLFSKWILDLNKEGTLLRDNLRLSD